MSLLKAIKIRTGAEDVPVAEAMIVLEEIADASPVVAAYLMARLYPVAGRKRYHEVFNGIELWIQHFDGVGVAEVLRRLGQEGVRRSLGTRYSAWATAIEERRNR